MTQLNTRIEHDLLGDKAVPADAYYGVHTLRAVENFPITGTPISQYPDLVNALACVKQAAANANAQLGLLDAVQRDAIVKACEEIRQGQWHDQFVVDVIQGGAGTSTNMNANEVVCNRALEILGHQKGEYQYLHPNEHVNMAQSTNDVYPTALHLATYVGIQRLLASMEVLRVSFDNKAKEFASLLKLGRTQLQDAVPMTLGQEFATYEVMVRHSMQQISQVAQIMCSINLGATAIGTGITTHPKYANLACKELAHISQIPVQLAENLIEATQDCAGFVQVSGVLKAFAVKLSKISNDLRLLSSGPRSGLGEINLPARQAGSSIMPGKVNPVIPEVVSQVAYQVFGYDATITIAAEAGQLQLNAFEPAIADCLYRSINHLANACETLAANCVDGITANVDVLSGSVARSISLVTALNPIIGYVHATEVAKEAFASGRTVREVVLEKQLMSEQELDHALRPEMLIQPAEYN